MSRRRAPGAPGSANRRRAPRTPSPIPGAKFIRVVCTDQGQHPEVSFGTVDVWPDGSGGWRVHVTRLSHRGDEFVDLAKPARPYGGAFRVYKTYPLKCRRCRRNVPLKLETLERRCAKLAAADTPKFDISDV
jgi:hypothetical protein